MRDFKGRSEGALGLRTAKRAKIPSKDLARGGTGAQNSKTIPSKDLARGGTGAHQQEEQRYQAKI